MKTPILFLRDDGSVHEGPPGIPVVRCAVPTLSEKVGSVTEMTFTDMAREGCWAQVDTGAGESVIDETYARELNLTPIGEVSLSGATGTRNQALYGNTFYLIHSDIAVESIFVSAPLQTQGRKFKFILGMSAISQGALVMDFKRGVYEIDFSEVAIPTDTNLPT